MAYTLALWTLAVLVDITAVMYFDSQRSMMILFVLGVYAAWRVVYQLVLYPKYFTPLKHLPMPEVRPLCHELRYGRLHLEGQGLVDRQ